VATGHAAATAGRAVLDGAAEMGPYFPRPF